MTVPPWSIDDRSHAAFVQLSGDFNPIHTDELEARRLPFGEVVVHGVHVLLRALDQWVAANPGREPVTVSATFRYPIGIGRLLTTVWSAPIHASRIDDQTDAAVDIAVDVDGVRAVDIRVATAAATRQPALGPYDRIRPFRSPATRMTGPTEMSLDELDGSSGAVPVDADADVVVAMFPALAGASGLTATRELVALSTLVGMYAPGRYSMLSSLSIELGGNSIVDASPDELTYAVTRVDRRFSRATISVTAPSFTATAGAFVRPVRVNQHVQTGGVESDEFAGQCWLVVGGSRGLGAAAVRLLVAGGADVRFTYHRGVEDAAAISTGTGAAAARFDVFVDDLAVALTAEFGADWWPTHLGWFASPPIFVGARGSYSKPLFERFVASYVDSFACAVRSLVPRGLVAALWPSSQAVVERVPGLAEYGDAKRLGERCCDELEQAFASLTIASPRLPRLLTDQTTSFVPVEFADTAIEILAALRSTRRER